MEVVLWLILLGIGILVLRSFLPAYTSEKGKNLATKEDIADITNEIELVRSSYAEQLQELQHRNDLLLEQLRSRQQLRMAAVEKRLEVHQHAYMLWRKLLSNAHSNAINPIILECQEWWRSNCLYLAPAARQAFLQAYLAASHHHNFLAHGSGATGADVRENYAVILKAGEAIVAGAELPTLGELEAEDVTEKTTPGSQKDLG